MNNPYDIHSWSKIYREERLAEARMTRLKKRLRENRKAHSGWSRLGSVLAGTLAFLEAAGQANAGKAERW